MAPVDNCLITCQPLIGTAHPENYLRMSKYPRQEPFTAALLCPEPQHYDRPWAL